MLLYSVHVVKYGKMTDEFMVSVPEKDRITDQAIEILVQTFLEGHGDFPPVTTTGTRDFLQIQCKQDGVVLSCALIDVVPTEVSNPRNNVKLELVVNTSRSQAVVAYDNGKYSTYQQKHYK